MSDNVRFHSKHHGKAHHTTASPGYYDSAVDPIASSGSPFMGNFNLSGSHVYYDTSVAADTSKTIGYSDFVDKYDPLYTTVKTQSSSWAVLSGDYWSVTSNTQHPNDLTNNVGIGTNSADEKLTVAGNISASGGLSALGGINYFGGNVGIGTTAPTSPAGITKILEIQDGNHAGIVLHDTSHGPWDIYANAGELKFRYNNVGSSETIFEANGDVTFSGNVGIGTTGPSAKLDVISSDPDVAFIRSSDSTTTNFYITNTNATTNNTANLYFAPANNVVGGLIQSIAIEDFSTVANRTADLAFSTRKDGTFGEALRIDSNGNVGIGTSIPNHELTVVGDISATGTIHGTSPLPAGGIIPYAGSTAPTGWLLCDGSTISSTTYNALYLVVGTTYGGDSSNFALPDLRGRMVAGVDAMNNSVGSGGGAASRLTGASTLAAVSGSETQTLSTHQMPSHTHDTYTGQANNNQNGVAGRAPKGSDISSPTIAAYSNGALTKGGDQPHQNMPPYLVLNYIIKT